MPWRTRLAGAVTACVVSVTGPHWITSSAASAGADIELGRYLASECMTCHRAQATASTIPNLTKIPREHFVKVVKAYRSKELPNPAMQNVAGRLSDDDIESLALYFSTTKQP